MENEKCYSCQGKGFYTQIHGIHGAEDFGGDGFNTLPTIHEYPCSACAGTGLKKVSPMPDTKTTKEEKCNAEKNGVKCRPPCKTCYGGAIITPSTIEERFKERFAERLSEIHGRTYLRLGIQLWDAEELFAFITQERILAQEELLRRMKENLPRRKTQSLTETYDESVFMSGYNECLEDVGLSLTNLNKDK